MKKTTAITDFFKNNLEYLAALFSFLIFLGISLTPTGLKSEFGFYDTLLHLKPEISERSDILLVNIDDEAIEQIGAWPWTRDVIGDALVRLRESGGKYTVFDIEYLSPGQTGVNRNYVKTTFPSEYNTVHTEILEYLAGFTEAVATEQIPLDYVPEFGQEMSEYVNQWMGELASSITSNIFQDNDLYFSRGLHFFGNSFVTINSARINTNEETQALNAWALENRLWHNVTDKKGLIPLENAWTARKDERESGISPAILPLLQAAKGAGFPNVVIDEDGVRRRIELLSEYKGGYVGQLVFAPILDILQPEKIERIGQKLILRNALDPKNPESGNRVTISIPLDDRGRMLINWLKKPFSSASVEADKSFRHISIYALVLADEFEEQLIINLNDIAAYGIRGSSGYLSYHDATLWLLGSYSELQTWKEGLLDGSRDDYDSYFTERKVFFDTYGEYLEGGYDTEIQETFARVKEATGDDQYDELALRINQQFNTFREHYSLYTEHVARLEKECLNSFCIVGYSGVGTSDLGVNPFVESYPNVGTHANIYNTIMNRELINPVSVWVSWVLGFVLSILSGLIFKRISSMRTRLLFGVFSILTVFASLALLFAFLRIYIQVFVPLLSVTLTFLLVSILKFVFSEQEKSFLRKAFGVYLSADVVDQIVENPSLLKLGGEEKQITAFFTDIRSFSSLSEKVTPEHLVEILNKYLTIMSDLILEQKGTIDKYIGDAIVAFFGAPLDLPDHASRACLAAVRMKQAEEKLNIEMLANNETPMPIFTRIGINTGSMVVGNMGTETKMNYTMMGNDVNLAARLEGVNKAYATWIMVSEITWNLTDNMFLGRKLDRVRVVGIDTPVQLYNIMAVRSEATEKMLAVAAQFNLAIESYVQKNMEDARVLFNKCLEIDPDDEPSKIYVERVRVLLEKGIPEDWTDVVNMTSK